MPESEEVPLGQQEAKSILRPGEFMKKRIDDSRQTIRDLAAQEPEKLVELILDSVDSQIKALRLQLDRLMEAIEALEDHRHAGDEIVVPLKHRRHSGQHPRGGSLHQHAQMGADHAPVRARRGN